MADIEIDVKGAVKHLVRVVARKLTRGYEVHIGDVVVFSDSRRPAAAKMARYIRTEVAAWLDELLDAIADEDEDGEGANDDEDGSDDDDSDEEDEEEGV